LFDSKLLPRAMQRTSHVNRGKTVTKPQAGRKPWQNTRVSNISELRSETTETKLVKTEFGRATGILCGPDWRQAYDSVGCRSLDEHLLFEALKTRRNGQTEGSTNLTTGPRRRWTASANKCAFISGEAENTGALINEGRSALCSTFFKQLRDVGSQPSKGERFGW